MTNISAHVLTVFDELNELNHGSVTGSWVTEMDLRWGALSSKGRSWDSGRAGDAANFYVDIYIQKSCIRETEHLSTDADSSTDTTVGWTKNTQKPIFVEKRKKSSKTQKLKNV